MWGGLLANLAIGVISAASTSIGTYLAKKEKEKEDGQPASFDLKKFARTMGTGFLSGLITYFGGGGATDSAGAFDPTVAATTGGASLGLVNILDQGIKFFFRLFTKK